MRKRVTRTLALIVLLLLVFHVRAHAQAQPGRIRLAAYNVEWMLDVFDDPYSGDEARPPKPLSELKLLAAAIRTINPDVVAFSELENEGLLRAFVQDLLGDMGYEYVAASPTNSTRGQNLGVISRAPILSITSHRFLKLELEGQQRTWRFARDLMEVKIQPDPQDNPAQTMDLLIVHLKSQLPSESDRNSVNWRLAEATAIKRIVNRKLDADPKALIAILGDFNDTPDSPTLHALRAEDGPQTHRMTDVHAGLEPGQRITFLKPPYRSTIDYILASPELARRVVPGSADLLRDEALLAGSDHAPVFATFDLR